MRIGILADIHARADRLRLALQTLRQVGVDQTLVLGDVVYSGGQIEETVALLREAGIGGVCGNHDLGLAVDPDDWARQHYSRRVLDYMTTLRPRLELAGCLFSHGLPHWEPTDPEVFYLGGEPDVPEDLVRCFDAFQHRVMFLGHFHRWQIATRAGPIAWDGRQPIVLRSDERYLVVVAAVMNGSCASFDATSGELVPYELEPP